MLLPSSGSKCVEYTNFCEMCRSMFWENDGGRVETYAPSAPIGTMDRKSCERKETDLNRATVYTKKPSATGALKRSPIQVLAKNSVASLCCGSSSEFSVGLHTVQTPKSSININRD
jgi:hypothetical protein